MTTTVACPPARSGPAGPRAGVDTSAYIGPVTGLGARGSAGGQAHEIGVEVDVLDAAFGAGGVAAERVLVARPVAVGDVAADAAAQDGGEFAGRAGDALAEVGRAPVLRCGVQEVGIGIARRNANSGRRCSSTTMLCLAEPPVAARTTGLAMSRSLSIRSANDLNRPLIPAL